MTLASGTRLGPYEITGALGAGGMGEVYRARDTRLQRDVALKVLPEHLSTDAERVARFRREAQLLAALNHPQIATIHGLEDANGSQFLVMELVEGETLADRLTRHAHGLPLDEAFSIARQVAEALQAAHEKGIIHRDLKPANIALTRDGDVKVLDFGLAKLLESDTPSATADAAHAATHSPTLSVAGTHVGTILGTAAYMAPEQAKGRLVDKRCDVWAFGCVLYEMLTGRRAFDGEDVTDIIGAVVRLEPNWNALPPECPTAIRTLLKRCLEKDRRSRVADISTAIFVLDEARGLVEEPAKAGPHVLQGADAARRVVGAGFSRLVRRSVAIVGIGAALLGGAIVGGSVWFAMRPAPLRVTRTTITPLAPATLTIDGFDRDITMTPDGSRIVYSVASATQLVVRPIDALESTALVPTTGGAQGLFSSPDGQWIGYVEGNTSLRRVAITGGPPLTIASLDGPSRGITWAANDALVFATNQPTTVLQRVAAAGGDIAVLTRPDRTRGEADHLWPEALPGGRKVLFTITSASGDLNAAQIAVLDLDTGAHQPLVRGGTHAHYVSSGHLIYAAGGALHAVGFDLDSLEVHGTQAPVVSRVVTTGAGAADFSVSADGTLVYVDAPGFGGAPERTLVWVDRQGTETVVGAPPRAYQNVRLSPDGTRVVLSSGDQGQDLWVWNFARETLTRLTFDLAADNNPVWTPDGRRVVFGSARAGPLNLYVQPADGTGTAERLSESSNIHLPSSATPDGSGIVFHELTSAVGGGPADVRLLLLPRPGAGPRSQPDIRTLVETPFGERNGVVSPDGDWLAYESNVSGQFEIYVRPFPNVDDGQWQVSTSGGQQPLWAGHGRELFYLAPDVRCSACR